MRLSPGFQEEIRKRIETVMKVIDTEKAAQVLNEVVAGRMEITKERMKAIEVALKHGVPVTKAIEISGPDGGPIETRRLVIGE